MKNIEIIRAKLMRIRCRRKGIKKEKNNKKNFLILFLIWVLAAVNLHKIFEKAESRVLSVL